MLDNDHVTCPYCSKRMKIIQHTHLKSHGKTVDDFKREFPNHPFRCQSLIDAALRGANKNKTNKDSKKKVKCVCGDHEKMVGKFQADFVYLQCCKSKGLDNPDKRTHSETQLKRVKTFQDKYGVENPHQISDAIDKAKETNLERYGGTGFASDKLRTKSIKTMIEKRLL
jgi:hypothetical protein